MKLIRLFTYHPASVGETYTQHLVHAAAFGARMLLAGAACLLHALFPFAFVNTASDTVRQLHDRMSDRRRRAVQDIGLATVDTQISPVANKPASP